MATIAVFGVLGGGAYAAIGIPDSKGVFHGCVSKRNAGLRVVESPTSCRAAKKRRGGVMDPGEFAISWNQQGPRGLEGIQGAQGIQGIQGIQGNTGAAGTARAFAHVRSDGTLDGANSSNVVDVLPRCISCDPLPAHGSSAWQCFKLGFTPKNAIATTEMGSNRTAARVQIPGQVPSVDLPGCPPGYQDAEAFTFDTTTGAAANAAFYIVFN